MLYYLHLMKFITTENGNVFTGTCFNYFIVLLIDICHTSDI